MMGSLLLAGNLLLAVPLRQNNVVVRSAEQSEREMRSVLIRHLTERGLESASAEHLVTEHFGQDGAALAAGVMYLAMLFPEVKREAILQDIATQVLQGQTVALDDYDYLVGMLSRLEGLPLSVSHYARIRQGVLLNRTMKSA
jgi:hypothetical protein